MRENLTKYDIANEIRLSRTQFKGVFIIVEGETDARVYGKIFSSDEYKVQLSHGKNNAIGALRILEEQGIKEVLAIVDADFDRLNSIDYNNQNIFLTDYHDLESMILNSPAIERIFPVFIKPEKKPPALSELLKLAYQAAIPIGILRWISLIENININFKVLDIALFVNIFTFECDINKILSTISQSENNPCRLDIDLIRKILDEKLKMNIDSRELCCGHDVVYIIYKAIKMRWGKKQLDSISCEKFSRHLYDCYDYECFKNTNLWKQIKDWIEKRN